MYASINQVQAIIPHLALGGTSKPSLSEVTGFLTRVSGEIDTALASQGVSVPVTTPSYFTDALDSLAAYGAAALALMAAFPVGPTASPAGSQGRDLWATYTARIAELRKGIGIPSEVSSLARNNPRSYFSDNGAIGDSGLTATDAWGDTVDARGRFRPDKRF